MTEKPIFFSGPMVRAILDVRKSMTRRIIKPQPPVQATSAGVTATSLGGPTDHWTWLSGDPRDCDTWQPLGDFKTGYVQGMRLWVRETWAEACELDDNDSPASEMRTYYRADGEPFSRWLDPDTDEWRDGIKWRSSIHMPRWASRITLEVTDVRVQRLQDISEEDAVAEGCRHHHDTAGDGQNVIEQFSYLWQSIYGPDSWAVNPWVVALTFRRVPQ